VAVSVYLTSESLVGVSNGEPGMCLLHLHFVCFGLLAFIAFLGKCTSFMKKENVGSYSKMFDESPKEQSKCCPIKIIAIILSAIILVGFCVTCCMAPME